MKTQSAQVAALIRKELKDNKVAATVRSSNFAGGDSVTVTLIDPVPAVRAKAEAAFSKYVYGRFDGMTDCFEYTNCRSDIPQVKYLHVNATYSDELRKAAKEYVATKWGAAGFEIEEQAYRVLRGTFSDLCRFWFDHKPRVRASTAA